MGDQSFKNERILQDREDIEKDDTLSNTYFVSNNKPKDKNQPC